MEVIQSKDNSLIKDIKKLKEKKHRNEQCMFLVEGFRFTEEALQSSFHIKYIFLNDNGKDKWESLSYSNKLKEDTKLYLLSDAIFKLISSTDNPQGIIAVVKNKNINIKDIDGVYILADKIQDPGNMGTIIRTAHASGALGVILTKGTVDVYNEKTLRSTMGSIFNIPIIEDKDLSLIRDLKEKGFKLITSSLDTDKNFYDVNLAQKVIISVGNEGNGISDEVYELSDIKVKIPMPGGAESLNAGVAASIMMYESVRQRESK